MTEAERARKREKTVMISMRLQKSTDADIIAFLDGKSKQTELKKAIREYIKNHAELKEEENK